MTRPRRQWSIIWLWSYCCQSYLLSSYFPKCSQRYSTESKVMMMCYIYHTVPMYLAVLFYCNYIISLSLSTGPTKPFCTFLVVVRKFCVFIEFRLRGWNEVRCEFTKCIKWLSSMKQSLGSINSHIQNISLWPLVIILTFPRLSCLKSLLLAMVLDTS